MSGFPWLPPWVSIICYNDLQCSGKHLSLWVCYITKHDKGYRWRAAQVRSSRIPSAGIPVPMDLGCTTLLPYIDVFTNLEALEPWTFGIFVEATSHKHDQSLTPLLALFPFPDDGWWGWKFQAFNYGLVFLVIKKLPSWSYSTKSQPLAQSHSYHLGNSKAFRSPVSGTGAETKYWDKRCSSSFHHLGNFKNLWAPPCV